MRVARALLVAVGMLAGALAGTARAGELAAVDAPPLPHFIRKEAAAWLNSAPLKVTDFRGRVLLLEFWAFDCVNCYRSIPWLQSLEQRYGAKGLRLLGVHTPELPQERVRDNVVAKLAQFRIGYPVMLDDDYAYWNALGNRYWPAFYLIDREGRMRALFIGETHAGDAQAQQVEAVIERLLAEPAAALNASTR